MSPQYPGILYSEQAKLVDDEIEKQLASVSDIAGFPELIREPLEAFKQRMAGDSTLGKPWHLLPLITCEAISGAFESAIPASAALQLFMAAAEVFDDIEDADAPGSLADKFGFAIATNVGTALLILAEGAISHLKKRGPTDDIVVRVSETFNKFYLTACTGQHLDLSSGSNIAISEDLYLDLITMKSASTIECACQVGALLGKADTKLLDSCTMFGRNLGIASQIANDIHGIIYGSDIAKKKITIPVIYALAHTEGEPHRLLEIAFKSQYNAADNFAQIRDLLFGCGAVHYASVRMELYKQAASSILDEMNNSGFNANILRFFLE